MAKGPRYKIGFRRREEQKTDYKTRLALVKSGKPRLVVRSSNKHITCQIVEFVPPGDKTLASASSMELMKEYKWNANPGNIPSAYLVGFLCGLKTKKAKITEVITDFGFRTPSKGAKIFASLKGALDAGLAIPHGEGMFPSDDRIRGADIAEYAKGLKSSDKAKYEAVFSKYIKNKLSPEDLPKYFDDTKSKIQAKFKT
ncbi:MAG: 50S ribosomal protein L18 [Candidatus Altiarchaeota archaeon]|nr:50S ribosomal protein L18 [Candidatus Altiarchaeota archaeon]